jgi:hypothetical protein
MLRGLISGVMSGVGGAYADVAKSELEQKQKIDYSERYLKMLEEIEKRVARFNQDLEIEGIPKKATATAAAAPILAAGEAAAAPIVATGKAAAAPILATGEAAAAPIVAGGQVQAQIAKTNMPGYLGSVRQESAAKESSATRAQAAATNFELGIKKDVADLRKELKNTTDPTKRSELEQQIKDLTGSLTTKSYGDMVTAAESYRKMAANLRKDAESVLETEERQALLDRAQIYEREADVILQATKGQRLPGSTSQPTAAAKPPASSKPLILPAAVSVSN